MSYVEGKREGVDWKGGGGVRQNCVNSLLIAYEPMAYGINKLELKFIQKRNCKVQEILKVKLS